MFNFMKKVQAKESMKQKELRRLKGELNNYYNRFNNATHEDVYDIAIHDIAATEKKIDKLIKSSDKHTTNFENNEQFQITIPKESWFAAKVISKNSFTLVGCTVAPGFEFADFELGKKDELIMKYPQHKEILDSLCKL